MLKPISVCSTSPPAPMLRRVSVRAWKTREKGKSGQRGSFSRISKPRMAYRVKRTARAQRDLAHLYAEINAEHSDAALEWYRGLKEAILRLEEQPNRCPVTPESDQFRHLLYGHKPHVYRAIY